MSNLQKKAEIKRQRERIANVSVVACTLGIVGIIFSPSIPITIAVTAISGGTGYIGLQKIKKLNEAEKSL